jgi:DeoR/GlpR family transcriptional regulator of sugar metabolism
MLASQRQSRILAELERTGAVRVSQIAELLGVSDMTVRRDLKAMQQAGMLVKVHGGARVRHEKSAAEPGFAIKSQRQQAEKEAIARVAADLVEPGSAIAVSAGTTTYTLARHLGRVPDLTVITNSARVAEVIEQAGSDSTTVLLTGGQRTPSDALVGPLAVAAWRSLHVDTCFLGVHGMHPETGFTTPNLLEAETNRAMIDAASRLVVVADSSKWGTVGLTTMAQLHEANVIVTDAGLDEEAAAILRSEIDEVILVEAAAHSEPALS